MKKLSLTEAAKRLKYPGGAYGLSMHLRYAEDLPLKFAIREEDGTWKYYVFEETIGILEEYFKERRQSIKA